MTATTSTVLRATPRDVIAHAWYHLGYRPANSLVLVAAGGPRLRLGLVLRVDLPPPTQPREVLHLVVHRLVAGLRRARATATVALVMSARALKAPPHRLIRSLRDVLAQRRIEVIDVIGVTPRVYRSLLCRRERCCPRAGHPVASVVTSNVSLAHILSGDVLTDATDPRAPAQGAEPAPDTGQPPPGRPESPAPASSGAADPQPPDGAPTPDPGHPPPAALTPRARAEWWRIWVAGLESGDLPEAHRPGFAWALADEVLRDAVMATAMGAPADAFEAPPAIAAAGVPTGLANVPGWQRWLEASPVGDITRLRNALQVMWSAALGGVPGHRADALTVLGVIGWYIGCAEGARLVLELAIAESRHHSLALTVLGLVLLDAPPPWAVTDEDDPSGARAAGGDVPHGPTGC